VNETSQRRLLQLAYELLRRPSPSGREQEVRNFVVEHLNKCGMQVWIDEKGNVLAQQGIPQPGEGYPLLSFHMDMVWERPSSSKKGALPFSLRLRGPQSFTITRGRIHTHGKRILGGDDKCGGAIALALAQESTAPLKIVASVEEEIGCVGIEKVDPQFFEDCSYALVLDRRGSSDLITSIAGHRLCSAAFAERIVMIAHSLGHRLRPREGMVSDALTLAYYVEEVINLSVGYYQPHSTQEYVLISDLLKAYQMVSGCLRELPRPLPLPYPQCPRLGGTTGCYDQCPWCGGWKVPQMDWTPSLMDEVCLCDEMVFEQFEQEASNIVILLQVERCLELLANTLDQEEIILQQALQTRLLALCEWLAVTGPPISIAALQEHLGIVGEYDFERVLDQLSKWSEEICCWSEEQESSDLVDRAIAWLDRWEAAKQQTRPFPMQDTR
jgi:hypothetical protein